MSWSVSGHDWEHTRCLCLFPAALATLLAHRHCVRRSVFRYSTCFLTKSEFGSSKSTGTWLLFFFSGRVYLWKRQVAYSGTSFWRSKPSTRVCWMSCAIASKVECYPRGSGRPQTLVWAGDLLCQPGLEKSKKGLCRLIVGRVVGGNPWYV